MPNWYLFCNFFFAANMSALAYKCTRYAKQVQWSRHDLEETRPLPSLSPWSPDKDIAAWLSSKYTWFTSSATFHSTKHTPANTHTSYAPYLQPKSTPGEAEAINSSSSGFPWVLLQHFSSFFGLLFVFSHARKQSCKHVKRCVAMTKSRWEKLSGTWLPS